MIAITVSAATQNMADEAAKRLESHGHAVRFYQADGVGGPAMERAILAGEITAVIDLTLSELIDHRKQVGPDRLTAAALKGIPQVIGLAGLTASDEVLDALGKEIAEKAFAARGPTRIVVPADAALALAQSLRNWVYPPELIVEGGGEYDEDRVAEVLLNLLTIR